MTSCSSFFSSLISHLRGSDQSRIFASDIASPSHEFEVSLAKKLETLSQHYSHGDCSLSPMSLTWLCQALDVVVSTQASAINTVRANMLSCSRWEVPTVHMDKVIQKYMEGSVKMLDACCLLKETLAGEDAHVKASQRALKRVQGLKMRHQGEIRRAKHALLAAQRHHPRGRIQQKDGVQRLDACKSMLRRMGDKLSTPPTHGHHNHHHLDEYTVSSHGSISAVSVALYGSEMSALFFLRLLSRALSSPAAGRSPRISSSSTRVASAGHEEPLWGPSLLAIQARLNILYSKQAKTQKHNAINQPADELHTLDASLQRIYQALLQHDAPTVRLSAQQEEETNLSVLVGSTLEFLDRVQSSIATLQHQLDSISSFIVDTRMALFDL